MISSEAQAIVAIASVLVSLAVFSVCFTFVRMVLRDRKRMKEELAEFERELEEVKEVIRKQEEFIQGKV